MLTIFVISVDPCTHLLIWYLGSRGNNGILLFFKVQISGALFLTGDNNMPLIAFISV